MIFLSSFSSLSISTIWERWYFAPILLPVICATTENEMYNLRLTFNFNCWNLSILIYNYDMIDLYMFFFSNRNCTLFNTKSGTNYNLNKVNNGTNYIMPFYLVLCGANYNLNSLLFMQNNLRILITYSLEYYMNQFAVWFYIFIKRIFDFMICIFFNCDITSSISY